MERFLKRRTRAQQLVSQRGQSAAEYMLVISTLVIGATFVTYTMFDDDANAPVKSALTALLGDGTDSGSQRNVPDQIQRGYISENP